MGKIEVEIPENVLRFLEAWCAFVGIKVEELVQRFVVGIGGCLLSEWGGGWTGIESEDLAKKYGLSEY